MDRKQINAQRERHQSQVIRALAAMELPSLTEAAEACGLSRNIVTHWRKNDPAFDMQASVYVGPRKIVRQNRNRITMSDARAAKRIEALYRLTRIRKSRGLIQPYNEN